jgi:large subunit ribosomal protein L22
MAFGVKTNEREGVRAQVRYLRVSAYKAREVLDLIRGLPVARALEVLELAERDVARPILKCLESAIANAEHNNSIPADELFVSACYADEGPTLKRWRPRARGRATRIRKRTCHITIIVSRLSADELDALRAREAATGRASGGAAAAEARRRRVARSRQAKAERRAEEHDHDHDHDHDDEAAEVDAAEVVMAEADLDEQADDVEVDDLEPVDEADEADEADDDEEQDEPVAQADAEDEAEADEAEGKDD